MTVRGGRRLDLAPPDPDLLGTMAAASTTVVAGVRMIVEQVRRSNCWVVSFWFAASVAARGWVLVVAGGRCTVGAASGRLLVSRETASSVADLLVLAADLARCAQGEISASVMLAGNGAACCRVFLVGGFVEMLSYLQAREGRMIWETIRGYSFPA